ncbi:MAG TPA: hypothetical protein VL614_14900 [Acetobacteraceae bacterium]|jgi:hypothetical protein|nr:hypothetical protein [Acetobacteraceae bacterium]
MASIIPAGQFNPASLQASGFYITITNPPSYITGVPTDVVGMVGTASWGPVNTPVSLGSGQAAQQAFGPMSAASLTDPFDLATDLSLAFQQSVSQASLQAWAVRVTDGTDTAASASLAGAASAAAATATIAGTITAGNTVSLTATSTAITGSPITVTYTVQSTDTISTIAAALGKLVNNNAALAAARISAVVAAAVISLYAPTTLTPAVVWTGAAGGTSPTETVTIGTGTATTVGAVVAMRYTGTGGNSASGSAQMTVAAGVAANTFNVAIVPPFGGNSEIYLGLPSAGFWPALKAALNRGMSPARGPSAIVSIPGTANAAVGAPTPGTFTFAGGTDGRSGVTTATLIGSNTAQPMTGLWSLSNLNPGVGIAWIVGCTDPSSFQSLLQFGQSNSASVLASMPSGTSTAAAQAAVQTNGIADPAFNYVKDWIYFFDTANKQQRLVPPTAVIGGMWATYAPQNSPDNKAVLGVVGTERNNPQTGNQPYTLAEIGQLQSAGITIVTNPINAGSFWGTWGGRSTSQDPATQPSEYWRMTSFIARSLAGFGGKYVGQLQSQQLSDPLRRQVKAELNQFFNTLFGLGMIDTLASGGGPAAVVLCELNTAPNASPGYGMNTPSSISQHFMFSMCQVLYLSSVWYFVLALQGGTTVTVNVIQGQSA